MVVYQPRGSGDNKRSSPRQSPVLSDSKTDARADLTQTREEIFKKREQRRRALQRKRQRTHFIMGGVLISCTLCAALILIWFTISDSLQTGIPVSSDIPSVIESGEYGHDMPEPPVDDDIQGGADGDSQAAGEGTETLPPSSEPPESTKYQSKTAGEMALTAEEIAELEDIILKAEAELYHTLTESDIALMNPSSDSTSSGKPKKPYRPPPEYRSISIYFEDLESGYSYSYNAERKYFIASLIKAPYCMYLYTLAEQGKCDLNEKITVEYRHVQEGTGEIAKKKPSEFPFEMTVRELMRCAIRSSDNTAVELLRKKYPHTGYQAYAASLGLKYPEDVKLMVNGDITAVDAGVYLKAIYSYIQDGKYGKELREDMLNTTNPMIRANYPVVRKYGWADRSFHDMALIEAPHPYILAICTDASKGTAADHSLMANISKTLAKFHKARYPEE